MEKIVNDDLLSKMEMMLNDYFNTGETLKRGLPTVEYLANQLNFSANFLFSPKIAGFASISINYVIF